MEVRLCAMLLVLSACPGSSDIERFEALPGAPGANADIGFTRNGDPLVIGGSSTFGEMYVQRLMPGTRDTWERAQGLAPFDLGTHFIRSAADGKLIANAHTDLYALDDEAGFVWTDLHAPARGGNGPGGGANYVYGADRSGAFYAGDFERLTRWMPGASAWTEVALPAGMKLYGDVGAAVIDPAGGVFAFLLNANGLDGIWAVTTTTMTKVVDAQTPETAYGSMSNLTADSSGNIYYLVCPQTLDHRYVFRLRHGATKTEQLASIPAQTPFCKSLQALPDGTLFLFAALDNQPTSPAAIYRLEPGADAFEQVTADDPAEYVTITNAGAHYVARDSSTIFGFGNGDNASGVTKGSF